LNIKKVKQILLHTGIHTKGTQDDVTKSEKRLQLQKDVSEGDN